MTSPLHWMPPDFVVGGMPSLLLGLRDPLLRVRPHVQGGGRGVGVKPGVPGLSWLLSPVVLSAGYTVFVFWLLPWL